MGQLQSWILAARLRTLPLAISGIGMGSLISWHEGKFNPLITAFSMLTGIFLQVLSNLANDYGDSIHGADHHLRKGPSRAVQSGKISPRSMGWGIVILAFLSLFSGVSLLWISFVGQWTKMLPLFIAGLCAIAAAYFYTNGKKPYGYQALGDISVFLFFGFLAVIGAYYVQNPAINGSQMITLVLPAAAIGFWSVAVLNLNNIRDMESDSLAGKQTIPLIIGSKSAKWYQTTLVLGGGLCMIVFSIFRREWIWLGFLPGFFLMVQALIGTWKASESFSLDAFLKPQALGTFLAFLGCLVAMALF